TPAARAGAGRRDGPRRARARGETVVMARPRHGAGGGPARGRQPSAGGSHGGMKVALMGRSMRGRFSGVVRYTDQLVRCLGPLLGENLTVFLTRAPDGLDGLPLHR